MAVVSGALTFELGPKLSDKKPPPLRARMKLPVPEAEAESEAEPEADTRSAAEVKPKMGMTTLGA